MNLAYETPVTTLKITGVQLFWSADSFINYSNYVNSNYIISVILIF